MLYLEIIRNRRQSKFTSISFFIIYITHWCRMSVWLGDLTSENIFRSRIIFYKTFCSSWYHQSLATLDLKLNFLLFVFVYVFNLYHNYNLLQSRNSKVVKILDSSINILICLSRSLPSTYFSLLILSSYNHMRLSLETRKRCKELKVWGVCWLENILITRQ